MIKTSLTRKLIIVFSSILVAVIALNIVFNILLLSKVHRDKKIDAMEELYKSLSAQYLDDTDNEKIIEIVKNSLSNENLRVFIWDEADRLVIDSLPLSHEEDAFTAKENQPDTSETPKINIREFDFGRRFHFGGRMESFLLYTDIEDEDKIYECDEYTIFSFTSFDNYEEKTLCLRSFFPNGYKALIQMPYASIDEAVSISNSLLLIVGAVMLLIGIIIVTITSRTIAKPIKELSQIAASMEKLDFSKKYTTSRKDEIGSLGESINSLSEKLEVTISELYQKNKKLLEDIELKSRIDLMRKEFIANASHELKTPIALISGYAEGLRDNVADDEASRQLYTDVIIEEAEKMNHIIRQMLDLMELDSAENILDGKVFSLSMLVEEAICSFSLILKKSNISLTCDFDEDCNVYGDYFRIYQAVVNYISNAINHVDDKKIIRVTIKKTGDKVLFSVYNTGVQISSDDKLNIWERFYKIDKAHTREYGGTGLGLSIVRSVLELHGGEYGSINHPDGVEFYFTLNISEESFNED